MLRPTTGQDAEDKTAECSALNGASTSCPFLTRSKVIAEEGGTEFVRAAAVYDHKNKKTVFSRPRMAIAHISSQ